MKVKRLQMYEWINDDDDLSAFEAAFLYGRIFFDVGIPNALEKVTAVGYLAFKKRYLGRSSRESERELIGSSLVNVGLSSNK